MPLALPETGARALVAGHFSTVGDIEVLRHVESRLHRLEVPFDVAPYTLDLLGFDPSWVEASTLDPAAFTHLIVVCGPYGPDYPVKYPHIFDRFRHCTHVGINLTMVAPLADCNPFDALLERDSDRTVRPDLSFLLDVPKVPVVGLCLARSQREYGARQLHDQAESRLRALLRRAGAAVVELDTTVPRSANRTGIGTPAEFESVCARLDALVTTRLHGTVLALKNGVPVLAVDAIAGRDKVTRQAELLGWPEIHALDSISDADLDLALARCMDPSATGRASACAAFARELLAGHDEAFAAALDAEARPERRPPVASGKGRLSQIAARYRHWKRQRFPRR
ncbi:polysaccharide pyruvyl transferase family protein [Paracoccus sp. Z118]|uniref:polysaccharide pyruvyl transferase family protein n=1 Tax=Paracoccus sp. Z118 TaxID=2851017 RepID=UPI001C2C0171|nr:polysaccharide pyruvyl transferase family protein [Paracoccus sp. Z118]MBV0891235.1 polysaccharide pyruvyl transferase family protein [Paracoccus sp. Z118]